MATKVTLSSPSVQHSRLTDDDMDYQEQPAEAQYHQPENTLPPNYTTKRPPTPPKSKQPSLPSWKQHRTLKHKDSNDLDSRSPDPSQSTAMNKSSSSNSSISISSKHTKNQQYMYNPQSTASASERNKDYLQQPPPLLQKKPTGHLDEYFISQEQMDLTHRHRDQLREENGLLKYHLHVLQYRLQAMESMWYDYYSSSSGKKRASWTSSHPSQHLQHPHRSWYQPESFPPSYFMEPSISSHMEIPNQVVPDQKAGGDESRHRRFRRQRSKSLPRNTSMPVDNDSVMGYSLQEQPFMFPPPPMFRPIPAPFPSRPPTFDRSIMVPPSFQTKRYDYHPSNNIDSDSDMDDSDSESNIDGMDDLDGDELHSSGIPSRQRRHPQHHRYRTDDMVDGSPLHPSSSYPTFRYQTSKTNLPMGPPPPPPFMTDSSFNDPYDIYSIHGEDYIDDGWNQRSALPRYYSNGNPQQQQQQHPSDQFTKYPRQSFYGDPQHKQQTYTLSQQRHPRQRGSRND